MGFFNFMKNFLSRAIEEAHRFGTIQWRLTSVNRSTSASPVKQCRTAYVMMSNMLTATLMGAPSYKGTSERFILWVSVLVVSTFPRNESIEIFAFAVLLTVIFAAYHQLYSRLLWLSWFANFLKVTFSKVGFIALGLKGQFGVIIIYHIFVQMMYWASFFRRKFSLVKICTPIQHELSQ